MNNKYHMERECLKCGSGLNGRSDKKFCNHHCRGSYHYQLKMLQLAVPAELFVFTGRYSGRTGEMREEEQPALIGPDQNSK